MTDADKIAGLMGFAKTNIIMSATGKTREQAMRIYEYEFELDYKQKRVLALEYWLGSGRRDKNRRHITIPSDNGAGDMTNPVWTTILDWMDKNKQSPA